MNMNKIYLSLNQHCDTSKIVLYFYMYFCYIFIDQEMGNGESLFRYHYWANLQRLAILS